jgi:hypothetical protein
MGVEKIQMDSWFYNVNVSSAAGALGFSKDSPLLNDF